MVGRATKQKGADSPNGSDPTTHAKTFPQEPSAPATDKDKVRWKGFCEIESEPVSILNLFCRLEC